MKRFTYILISFVLASCGKIEISDTHQIGLRAGIGEMEVVSKASTEAVPYKGTVPTSSSPLDASVWFSLKPDKFEDQSGNTFIPCHTEMKFTGEGMTYADYLLEGSDTPISLTYPTSENTPVYCVGFYPKTGWTTSDYVNAGHAINGTEDLMHAGVISGTWNNHFPSQQYSHLLTWVKISVCAMTMETARQWGNVTKVTISCKNALNINLATSEVTYSGEQEIIIYEDSKGSELSLTSTELGSLFCAPETEYEIKIKTANYGEKTITVPLSDLNYNPLSSATDAVGKLFIISLYFNPFNIIEGTCTLNYWNDQNEDLYLK